MKRKNKIKKILKIKNKFIFLLAFSFALSAPLSSLPFKDRHINKIQKIFSGKDFNNAIKEFNIDYKYEEDFKTGEYVDKLFLNHKVDHEMNSEMIEYEKFEFDTESNNKKVSPYNVMFPITEIPASRRNKILSIIYENLIKNGNYKLLYSESDIENLKCVLKDFSIFYTSGFNDYIIACVVTNSVMMLLNEDKIKEYAEYNQMNYDEAESIIIEHETNHLLQLCCSCYSEEEKGLMLKSGISKVYNNDDINLLWWSWYLEAADEELCDISTSYVTERYYLNLLEFVLSIQTDYKKDTFTNLAFYHDPDPLKDIFDMEDSKDVEEFINMMFSLELLMSNPYNVFVNLSKKYNSIFYKENFRGNSFIDALKTITKYFFKNLSDEVIKGNLTVYDGASLIIIFENLIDKLYAFDEINGFFYEFYDSLKDKYFVFSSSYYNSEELKDIFRKTVENYSSDTFLRDETHLFLKYNDEGRIYFLSMLEFFYYTKKNIIDFINDNKNENKLRKSTLYIEKKRRYLESVNRKCK